MAGTHSAIGPDSRWHLGGIMGVVTSFILLSFYSVIGGWVLIYLMKTLSGGLKGLSHCGYSHLFNGLIASPVVIIIVFLDVLGVLKPFTL